MPGAWSMQGTIRKTFAHFAHSQSRFYNSSLNERGSSRRRIPGVGKGGGPSAM
jgi:hypothetical protein